MLDDDGDTCKKEMKFKNKAQNLAEERRSGVSATCVQSRAFVRPIQAAQETLISLA